MKIEFEHYYLLQNILVVCPTLQHIQVEHYQSPFKKFQVPLGLSLSTTHELQEKYL